MGDDRACRVCVELVGVVAHPGGRLSHIPGRVGAGGPQRLAAPAWPALHNRRPRHRHSPSGKAAASARPANIEDAPRRAEEAGGVLIW